MIRFIYLFAIITCCIFQAVSMEEDNKLDEQLPEWVQKTLRFAGNNAMNTKSFKVKHLHMSINKKTGVVTPIHGRVDGDNILLVTDERGMPYAMLKRYEDKFVNSDHCAKKEQLLYRLCQQYELLHDVVPAYFITGEISVLYEVREYCGVEKYVTFYESEQLLKANPLAIPVFPNILRVSAHSFSMSKFKLLNKCDQKKFYGLIDKDSYFSALFASILFNFQDATARNILCRYTDGRITLHFTDTGNSFDAPTHPKYRMLKPFLLSLKFASQPFPKKFAELAKSLDFPTMKKFILANATVENLNAHIEQRETLLKSLHQDVYKLRNVYISDTPAIQRKLKTASFLTNTPYGDPFDNLRDRIKMFKNNTHDMTSLSVVEFLFKHSPDNYRISLIKCYEDGYECISDSGRGFDILKLIKCPELKCEDLWEEMYKKYTDGITYTEKWEKEFYTSLVKGGRT